MDIYSWLIIIVFLAGYFFITIEHYTRINKATIALLMAVLCWVLQFLNPLDQEQAMMGVFCFHLSNISQVVLFLLGALTIVELVNVHRGFNMIANMIRFTSKRKLLWVIGFIAFFLSSILDNLTTTIVMVSLLKRLLDEVDDRLIIGGAVVIAANAGGAWTPIGDVTTTMLWIGGQVSTLHIMKALFLPSLASLVAALGILSFFVKGEFKRREVHLDEQKVEPMGTTIFFMGIAALVFVPIFKLLTGLPPFMGMLFGMSVLWLTTDIMHRAFKERSHLRVPHVLTKIDISGTLFFLGVLLCISALEAAGLLEMLAHFLDRSVGNVALIATSIGLASSVIDNVPLVAATMGMYDMAQYPVDHTLWSLIALAAGTGGSILLIGSAAGIVFMGLENVDFGWYLRRITLPALVSFFVGIGVYLLF